MIIGEKNLIIGMIDTIINDLSKSVFSLFLQIKVEFFQFLKQSKRKSKLSICSPPIINY